MKSNKEIQWKELQNSYRPSDFSFKTTDELEPKEGLIGQEEAIYALQFGLSLGEVGYNMYISGDRGIGLYDEVVRNIRRIAKTKEVPNDLCYIYNFEDSTNPIPVFLEAGDGIQFKEDMKEFVSFLKNELTQKLDTYEAEKKKENLLKKLSEEKEALLKELKKVAENLGFSLQITEEEVAYIPFDEEGKELTEEEFSKMSEDEKDKIKANLKKLADISEEVGKTLKDTEKLYENYLMDVDEEIVLQEVSIFLKHLNEKYGKYPEIKVYLETLAQDIISNIDLFNQQKDEEMVGLEKVFPWLTVKNIGDVVSKYEINLLVDHSEQVGAPVVCSATTSYSELVGKIKVNSELGMIQTSLQNLSAGQLHQANGGYLVIDGRDLVERIGVWDVIKNVLKTGELSIENYQNSVVTTVVGIKPQPAKVKLKVVIVGGDDIYYLLSQYDKDFKYLFRLNVSFDNMVDTSSENIYEVAKRVSAICQKRQLPHLTIEAVLALVMYSNKLAGSKEKLLVDLSKLEALITQAAVFTTDYITKEHIDQVMVIHNVLKQRIDQRQEDNYKKEIYLIETSGSRIGQINGLGVQQIDELQIGSPIKITATTYKGREGIINVEKAAGLSGRIHTKGVEIIEGFLGNEFAQKNPLSLSCRICMEQSYGGVDGDSASSAELFAILSSLADVPIDQGLAVTGSINQYGQIQPIGGVNAKIEGFYDTCKAKGLTGQQGVIIPWQNTKDLLLKQEIIDAVKANKFHIYQIKEYTEGIELLTGVSYEVIYNNITDRLKGVSSNRSWLKSLRNR